MIAKSKISSLFFEKNSHAFYGLLLILIITIIVFSNSLKNDFIINWDDNINVSDNTYIKTFSWESVKILFSEENKSAEPRIPLLTFMIQYHFSKLNATPYHIANLLIHLINIILTFFLVKKITKNGLIAVVTTLLFAIHPTRVEAVDWVTGRKDLLFGFFFLSSLLLYLKYIKSNYKLIWLFIACSANYLALFCKLQAYAIPIIFLLMDYYYNRKIDSLNIFEKIFCYYILLFVPIFYPTTIVLTLFLIIYKYRLLLFKFLSNIYFILKQKKKWINYLIILLFIVLLIPIILFTVNNFNYYNIKVIFFIIIIVVTIGIYEKKISLNNSKIIANRLILVLFILTGISIACYYLINNTFLWTKSWYLEYSFFDRIFFAGYTLFFYLIKFIFPYKLMSLYPYPQLYNGQLPAIYYLYSFISLLLITAFIVAIKKRILNKLIVFGILFFLINISLVLHIIPIEGRSIASERYTYIAYIGLFIFCGYFFNYLLKIGINLSIKIVFISIICLYITSFGFVDYNRNKVWKNGITLFTDLISKNPKIDMAYNNRGMLYFKLSEKDKALADYNKSISLNPKYLMAYYNRSLLYIETGKNIQAYNDCVIGLKIDSANSELRYLKGYSLYKLKNYNGAIQEFTKVLKTKNNIWAYYNRGICRNILKDYNGAISDYSNAIKIDNTLALAYNARGVSKYFAGDYLSSIDDYDKAINLMPNNGNNLYNRGLSFIKLNKLSDACNDFNNALKYGFNDSEEMINKYCK